MYSLKRPRRIFTAVMFGITIFITAFIPFFSQLSTDISILSLCFGQVALALLFILAAFPKADYPFIVKLGTAYLVFITVCFAVLGFMPFAAQNKLFTIHAFTLSYIPSSAFVDLPSLVFLNISSFIYMNLGYQIFKPVSTDKVKLYPSTIKTTQEIKEVAENLVKEEVEVKPEVVEKQNELKTEVDSLFSVYLNEDSYSFEDEIFENETQEEKNKKLNVLEGTLLKFIDPEIEEAICMDLQGEALRDSVFKWDGVNPKILIELFKKHNRSSEELNTGRLCQMLVNSKEQWYIIARYRQNYLALKTSMEDPAPLLETAFNVFKSL